jgi:hypothetical protein
LPPRRPAISTASRFNDPRGDRAQLPNEAIAREQEREICMAWVDINGLCHLPSHAVWDEAGRQILDPGNLPLTEAVAEMVRSLGFECSALEIDLEHESRTFYASAGDKSYYVNVVHLDPDFHVTMQTLPDRTADGYEVRDSAFSEFAEALSAKMAADDRFEEVKLDA